MLLLDKMVTPTISLSSTPLNF